MSFAEKTSVPIEKTRAEIERYLSKAGATHFASGWDDTGAAIMFGYKGKRIRFVLPMPRRDDKAIVLKPGSTWLRRTPLQQQAAYEQACRTRWRALLLSIKSKIETVEAGISSFEQEFLAFVVLPSGKTVHDEIIGQLDAAYQSGAMPPLLGQGSP